MLARHTSVVPPEIADLIIDGAVDLGVDPATGQATVTVETYDPQAFQSLHVLQQASGVVLIDPA